MSETKSSSVKNEQIKIIDTHRLLYFVTFVFSFLITEFGRNVYRPYIYGNHINDYGLADAIGNLGGIVVQIFFMLAILNLLKRKAYLLITLLPFGYVLYEIVQPYLPRGVFDWKDVWGTFIGGFIGFFIYLFIIKKTENKVIINLGK